MCGISKILYMQSIVLWVTSHTTPPPHPLLLSLKFVINFSCWNGISLENCTDSRYVTHALLFCADTKIKHVITNTR